MQSLSRAASLPPTSKMTSICVYTNVVGTYESRLYAPRRQSQDMRFFCFSDHPTLSSEGWEILKPAHPREIQRPDLINRYHKFFAHELFPEADYSIYVDANLQITGDLSALVAQLRSSGTLLGAARHPERYSYSDEVDVCLRTSKFRGDDALRALAQKENYDAAGVPRGLLAAGLLVRKHGPLQLARAMELWWDQVCRYTARDQISLPFVLWNTALPYTEYDFNILKDNPYTSIHGHGDSPSALRLAKHRIMRSLRSLAWTY
jgi:hypothetical protein